MAYKCPIDQIKFEKYKKDTIALQYSLQTELDKFEKVDDWADVEKRLRNFKLHFEKYRTPYISQKKVLYRRFAQCFSPNLPLGCHKTTLEIYDIILANIQSAEEDMLNELYYFSLGIFPFFQISSNQLKPVIINLVLKYYIPLGTKLGPMIMALMGAFLPTMIEKNEAIQKLVFDMLDKLFSSFEPSFVYVNIWVLIFRSPKCRYGALLYLFSLLKKKDRNFSQIEKVEGDNEQIDNLIEEPKVFDLNDVDDEFEIDLIQNLPEEILEIGEKDLKNKDNKNQQGSDNFLPNPSSSHQIEQDESLKNIEEQQTLQNVTQNDQVNQELNPQLIDEGSKVALNEIQNLINKQETRIAAAFNEEGIEEKGNEIDNIQIEDDSFQERQQNDQPQQTKIFHKKQSKDDFDVDIVHEIDGAIKENFADTAIINTKPFEDKKVQKEENKEKEKQPDLEKQESDSGDYNRYIEFSTKMHNEWIEDIQKHCKNEVFPNKDIVIKALKVSLRGDDLKVKKLALDFLSRFIPKDSVEFNEIERTLLLREILLLFEMSELTVKRRIFGYIFGKEDDEPIIPEETDLIIFFKALKSLLDNCNVQTFVQTFRILQITLMERDELVKYLLSKTNKEIINAISRVYSSTLTKEEETPIKTFCVRFFQSIENYLEYFLDLYCGNDIEQITEGGVEVFIRFGEVVFQDENPNHNSARLTLLKGFIQTSVQKQKNGNSDIYNKLLELAKTWDDLKLDEKFTSLSLSYLQGFSENMEAGADDLLSFERRLRFAMWIIGKLDQKEVTETWVSQIKVFLRKIVKKPRFSLVAIRSICGFLSEKRDETKVIKILELAIKQTWQLLDEIDFQIQALSILLELNSAHCQVTINILFEGLSATETIVREANLKRCMVFWKLTANVKLREESKKLEDFIIGSLLEHTEHEHPVLRQIAKSWLLDSAGQYIRIADSLLIVLIQNCRLFLTIGNRYFHCGLYDIKAVSKTCTKLKNLITNNPQKFALFALESVLSDEILPNAYDLFTTELQVNKLYHQLIISLMLRYLQAGVIPFMGKDLFHQNLLINTDACELLELCVKTILARDPEYLKEELIELLLNCYYLNVREGSQVMQIHTLNLLKIILFQSGFLEQRKKNLSLFENIFSEKRLLQNVIDSLKLNQNNYTMMKIVDFLLTTIELFAQNMPEIKLKDMVEKIYLSYYNYLFDPKREKSVKMDFDNSAIIIDAMTTLASKFFNLNGFILPDKNQIDKKGFFSMFSSKIKDKNEAAQFKLVEQFFLDNFDKVVKVILSGWKITKKDGNYGAFTLGLNGVEQSKTIDKQNKIDDEDKDFFIIYVEKLFSKYKKEFFESVIRVWSASYCKEEEQPELIKNNEAEKIIDIIIAMEIEISTFQTLILESNLFKQTRPLKKKIKDLIPLNSISQVEISLLGLYYGFLKFKENKFINEKSERMHFLRTFWLNLIDFLKLFSETKLRTHIGVNLWIINIYVLCSEKFPLIEIISEYSIKKTLHLHENEILEKIVYFVSENDIGKLIFEPNIKGHSFIRPLPSRIVDQCIRQPSTYLSKIFTYYPQEHILRYFWKILAMGLLKENNMKLFKATYGVNKNKRIAIRVYNLVSELLKYLEILLREKTDMNQYLYEEILEYIYIFLEEARAYLLNDLKSLIQNFLDSDFFFECSPKALLIWSKIINWHVQGSGDGVISGYLDNVKFSSVFKSASEELKGKLKSEKDRLLKKEHLKSLLDKIKDVINNQNTPPSIFIIMFFCLRILLYKTSSQTFSEMFYKIWPILYTVILSLINNEILQEELNVKVACLKLLEIISLCYQDSLNLTYYSLGIDFFNCQFSEVPENIHNFVSEFPFIPFLCKLVKNNLKISYGFVQNETTFEEIVAPQRRKLIVKKNKVENEKDLSDVTLELIQYFIFLNSNETKLESSDIDSLIIEDFISLHEFTKADSKVQNQIVY